MDRLVIPVLTPAAGDVVADLVRSTGAEVVAVAIDFGHDTGLDGVRDAALAAGARRCHVVDRRDALAEGACWPALRAGALAAPGAPILTALSMPVVADVITEIVRHEGAAAAAVWADDPADRQRLRALLRATLPESGLVAVTRDGPAPAVRNLWAEMAPLARAAAPRAAPAPRTAGRATVVIGFERGLPIHLSGVPMPPVELIGSLATIAADHGVGAEVVQDAASGRAWTLCAPAARVLQAAMQVMTARVVDARTADLLEGLAAAYADVVRDGAWHSPMRAGIDACMDRVLAPATGEVTLHIVNGRIEGDA